MQGSQVADLDGPLSVVGGSLGSFNVNIPAAPAPTVTSVVIDDGNGATVNGVVATQQRSMIRRMIVTFSEAVTFAGGNVAAAFTLARNNANSNPSLPGPNGNVTLTALQSGSSVTITFSGAGFVDGSGSLVDGRYDLTIDASKVSGVGGQLDGNGDLTGGDNYTNLSNPFPAAPAAGSIFRLFGDANGDGIVNNAGGNFDFTKFRASFGTSDPFFNFDNIGLVAQPDFNAFRARFGFAP